MSQKRRCSVSGLGPDLDELHRRVKQLEEELRAHDVDEGYEWPCSEPNEREQSAASGRS